MTLIAKGWLKTQRSVEVEGMERFEKILASREAEGRGVITVSNHISTVDDPLLWGTLPLRTVFKGPSYSRYSLGSADICYTNATLSTFFSLGQTLPTYRFGKYGPFQPSISRAIHLLSPDYPTSSSQPKSKRIPSLVHVFPEGKIRQHPDREMRYFKWGISRMILESCIPPDVSPEKPLPPPPIVVPIFFKGLDDVMHENRKWPRFLPRMGKDIKFTFGEPLPDEMWRGYRQRWAEMCAAHNYRPTFGKERLVDFSDEGIPEELKNGEEAKALRSEIAAVIREEVAKVRKKMGLPEEDLRAKVVGAKLTNGWGDESNIIEKEPPVV
ncbi:Lyso-phosphatidylcholine acyltransferase [Saitoella coloradoensis]